MRGLLSKVVLVVSIMNIIRGVKANSGGKNNIMDQLREIISTMENYYIHREKSYFHWLENNLFMNIKKYSCSTPPFVEIFICKYLLFQQTLKNSNLHVSFTCFFACSNTHGTLLYLKVFFLDIPSVKNINYITHLVTKLPIITWNNMHTCIPVKLWFTLILVTALYSRILNVIASVLTVVL